MMMALGSLVAFGLVFSSVSLGLSLGLNTTLHVSRRRLRRMGPWVERQAATAALVLPPLLALAVVAALGLESMLALADGTDHCLAHLHHLHLCVRHGAAWVAQPWAPALLAATTTFVAVRFGYSAWAHALAQRAANRLRALGAPLGAPACYLVPAGERFAFTAGVFSPAVIFSTAAWDALRADEREAILSHELAHLAHGDLWRRAVLGIAASLGAPVLVGHALRLWELSAERICDRRAALVVGRPSTVASAMLALVRNARTPMAPAGAVFAAASNVPQRIESLLTEESGGEHTARRVVFSLSFAAVLFAVACAVFAEPLHHALETILG